MSWEEAILAAMWPATLVAFLYFIGTIQVIKDEDENE